MHLPRVLLLLPLLVLGACRDHVLEDGTYAFELKEVLRDDCALASSPGVLSTGLLATTGHIVQIDYDYVGGVRLVGTYLVRAEQMTLDGTVVNVRTDVRGQSCLLDTVAVHLDAETQSPTRFDGVMSVTFDARRPDECVCQLWLTYTANRTGGGP